jgi:hypothetical protein
MKRKIPIIVPAFFILTIAVCLLSSPAHSFWYGKKAPNGNPIFGGNDGLPASEVEVDIQNKTCNELWLPGRNNDIIDTLGGLIRGFDNSVPDEPPLTMYNSEKAWDGYTLLSCAGNGCRHEGAPDPETRYGALLIDMDGGFVNGWLDDEINGVPAKMLPGGYVMGGTGRDFGGTEGLVIQDWDGNQVWGWSVVGPRWHHDFNRESNPVGYYAPHPDDVGRLSGKTIVLTNHRSWEEYSYEPGSLKEGHPIMDTSHISKFRLWDDSIYLLDSQGRIKWQWFALQHFDQMGHSDKAKAGIMNIYTGRPNRGTDYTHYNNINWLGHNLFHDAGNDVFNPKNIIFDSRSQSMMGIIAAHDNPGQWESGDVIWRVGPDYGPGEPWEDLGRIIAQHTVHMIPWGLPGAGNILLFDNGGTAGFGGINTTPGDEECTWEVLVPDGEGGEETVVTDGVYPVTLRDYSRVVEFNPETFELVWEYKNEVATMEDWENDLTEDDFYHRKFFSSFISSVQRLPNGNTLVCEGNQARIFEVTPEGQIVWEYNADSIGGGNAPGVVGDALYRAYRYPKSWVPETP